MAVPARAGRAKQAKLNSIFVPILNQASIKKASQAHPAADGLFSSYHQLPHLEGQGWSQIGAVVPTGWGRGKQEIV
jgi:hypothetical protein